MAIKEDYAGVHRKSIDYRNFVNKINPTIVQIGAHDGIVGEEYGLQEFLESISDFNLVLVEPLEKYFNNLINVYEKFKDKVKYKNYAIADTDGYVNMFDKGGMSHIDNSGNLQVKCKSWNNFILETNIKKIDLLLLDCEGYEFDIIKQINFNNLKPKIIRYEYHHMPNKRECDKFLMSLNYKIRYCYHDHINNKTAILQD